MFIDPNAAFRMHSIPDPTVPEEITQFSIEIFPEELLRTVKELNTATVLLIVDDEINTFPEELFRIRQVLLSLDPPEITQLVSLKFPV